MKLKGRVFGRLTVIADLGTFIYGSGKQRKGKIVARCECGIYKEYWISHLNRGFNLSCGCLQIENRKTQNGLSSHPLHNVWQLMKSRCMLPKDKSYHNYGGRGITVCEEWMNYLKFYEWGIKNGWKRKLQLDRIDNNKGYSPNNCRFVTARVNMNNTRKTKFLSLNGEVLPRSEWALKLNIPYSIINQRVQNKWSDERILTQPIRKSPKRKKQ